VSRPKPRRDAQSSRVRPQASRSANASSFTLLSFGRRRQAEAGVGGVEQQMERVLGSAGLAAALRTRENPVLAAPTTLAREGGQISHMAARTGKPGAHILGIVPAHGTRRPGRRRGTQGRRGGVGGGRAVRRRSFGSPRRGGTFARSSGGICRVFRGLLRGDLGVVLRVERGARSSTGPRGGGMRTYHQLALRSLRRCELGPPHGMSRVGGRSAARNAGQQRYRTASTLYNARTKCLGLSLSGRSRTRHVASTKRSPAIFPISAAAFLPQIFEADRLTEVKINFAAIFDALDALFAAFSPQISTERK
jgi:hypothetical protein